MLLVLLNLLDLFPLLFFFESFYVVADLLAEFVLLSFNGFFFLFQLLDLQVESQLHVPFLFSSALCTSFLHFSLGFILNFYDLFNAHLRGMR